MKSDASIQDIQNIELEILKEFHMICVKHNIKYSLAFGTLLGSVRHHGFIPWDDDIDIIMSRKDFYRFKKIAAKEMDTKKFFFQDIVSDKEYPGWVVKIRDNSSIVLEKEVEHLSKMNHGAWIDLFILDGISSSFIWKVINHIYIKSAIRVKRIRMSKNKLCKFLTFHAFFPMLIANLFSFLYLAFRNTDYYGLVWNLDIKTPFNPLSDVILADFCNNDFYISTKYDEWLTAIYGEWRILPPINERKSNHNVVYIAKKS